MASIPLSQDELCFAILVDTCNIACGPLFQVLMAAVKHCHPRDWVDIICAPFSSAVEKFVRASVQQEGALVDIYAVCKLFCCRINDIARFCGQQFADPRCKERLSLQVQALVTARNIAFHAQRPLSAREVHCSVAIVLSVLTSAMFEPELSADHERLRELLLYSGQLHSSDQQASDCQYFFAALTVAKALLQGSLFELQSLLQSFFASDLETDGQSKDAKQSLEVCSRSKESEDGQTIQSLLKQVRRTMSQKRTICATVVDDEGQKVDCIASCKRILLARNGLAHSHAGLAFSEIEQALSDVRTLLKAFRLRCERPESGLGNLQLIKDGQETFVCRCQLNGSCMNGQSADCQRLLLPRARKQFFVGRADELLSIQTALSLHGDAASWAVRAVLIFGQAGVGKSFLSLRAAQALEEIFPVQKWVTCSRCEDIYEDIGLMPLADSCFSPQQQNTQLQPEGIEPCSTTCITNNATELWVLDNVCSPTVDIICQLIKQTSFRPSIIMTTRSRTVRRVLEEAIPRLHTVELKPFALAESKHLLDMKIGASCKCAKQPVGISDKDFFLNNVLGNLPLCVSIFSSLVNYAEWHTTDEDIRALVTDKALLVKRWREVETHFGDHFHVRGLSGVLDSAEKFLEDQPLATLLFAKICLANSESIPWCVLQREPESRICGLNLDTPMEHTILTICWLNHLTSALLGMIDWLFSKSAGHRLEACREVLEEFGLISWDPSMSCVHIHRLMLEGFRKTLHKRSLFVDSFLFLVCRKQIEIEAFDYLAKRMSEVLFAELFKDLSLSVTEQLVRLAVEPDLVRGQSPHAVLQVFHSAQEIVPNMQLAKVPPLLQHFCIDMMVNIAHRHAIRVVPSECVMWAQILQGGRPERPLAPGMAYMSLVVALLYLRAAEGLARLEDHKAWSCFESALAQLSGEHNTSKEDTMYSALIHIQAALYLEQKRGRHVRQEFLKKALVKCPLLSSCDRDIRAAYELMTANSTAHMQGTQVDSWIFSSKLWCELLVFRIRDCFQDNGVVDQVTVDSTHMLVVILQKLQQLMSNRRLEKESSEQSDFDEQSCIPTVYCCRNLLFVAHLEYRVWVSSNSPGHAVRALVTAFNAIEANLFNKGMTIHSMSSGHSQELCYALVCACMHCCHDIKAVGAYCLGMRLTGKVVEWVGHKDLPQAKCDCVSDTHIHGSAILHRESFAGALCMLQAIALFAYRAIFDFYQEKNARTALAQLMSALGEAVHYSQQTAASLYKEEDWCFLFCHVECLCGLLGKEESLDAVKVIFELSETKHNSATWRNILRRSSVNISKMLDITELSMLYTNFSDAKQSFQARDFSSAYQHTHLVLASSDRLRRFIEDNGRDSAWSETIQLLSHPMVEIIHTILLDAFSFLAHIHQIQDDYSKAHATIQGSLQMAVAMKVPLLAVKCRFEHAKFLKNWGKLLEAVEQWRIAQSSLVAEFGNDYLQWLVDAPDAAPMLW